MIRIHLLGSASVLGLCAIVGSAAAQEAATSPGAPADVAAGVHGLPNGKQGIEEVVVTAERHLGTAQKTAASISVRSGAQLLAQGRYQLSDILNDVPGVVGGAAVNTGSSNGSGTDNPASGLTIRGIQSNSGAGGSPTSTAAAAAIYVDDVYSGIGGSYDIDRVEVLRGPQGTLYGRSATSGVVAIHTHDPQLNGYGGDAAVEIGDYDLRHFMGDVNVPIIPGELAVRAAGNIYERDGFYSAGGNRTSSYDGRVKMLYKPTEDFTALLGYSLEDNTTHTGGVDINETAPGQYSFVNGADGTGTNKFRQYWGDFNWNLGQVALTYIPAYRSYYEDANIVSRGAQLAFNQYIHTPQDWFLTQELRAHSNYASPIQWQTGFFYYNNHLQASDDLILFPINVTAFNSLSHKSTENYGAFAEATWSVEPTTRLTGGIRYDYTSVQTTESYTGPLGTTATLTGDEGLRTFNNVTFKARIEQDLAPRNLVYASVASGASPGDVTITQNMAFQPVPVTLQAETLTAYEIGSKNRFLNNRFQLNVAGYYNDYGGYQTAGINTTPQDPGNPTFSTIAAPVRVYGAELELILRPWADGQFAYNMSYTNAAYSSIPAAYAPLFSTHVISGVPPIALTATYDHHLTFANGTSLSFHAQGRITSPYQVSRITLQQQEGGAAPYVHANTQAIGDFSATYNFGDDRFGLSAYVRNVSNNRYNNGGVMVVTAPPMTPIVTTTGTALSDPRTYGLILTAHF